MADDVKLLHLLYSIAHATNSSLDLEDTLQALLSGVQEALGVRGAVVRLRKSRCRYPGGRCEPGCQPGLSGAASVQNRSWQRQHGIVS
jgi:hypothetical protein